MVALGVLQTFLSLTSGDPTLPNVPAFFLNKDTNPPPSSSFTDDTYDALWISLQTNGSLYIQMNQLGVLWDSRDYFSLQWLPSSMTLGKIYNVTVVFAGQVMSVHVNGTVAFALDCSKNMTGSLCVTNTSHPFILPGFWQFYTEPVELVSAVIPSLGTWAMYSTSWVCKRQCNSTRLALLSLNAANSFTSSLWSVGLSPGSSVDTAALLSNVNTSAAGLRIHYYNTSSGLTYGGEYYSDPNQTVGPYGQIDMQVSYAIDSDSIGLPAGPFCVSKKTDNGTAGSVDGLEFCFEGGSVVRYQAHRLGGLYSPFLTSPITFPVAQSRSFSVQIFWSAFSFQILVDSTLVVSYSEASDADPTTRFIPSQAGYFIFFSLLSSSPSPQWANTTWTVSDFRFLCGDENAIPPNLCNSGSRCVGSTLVVPSIDLTQNTSTKTITDPIYVEGNLTVPSNRILQIQVRNTTTSPLSVQGCASLAGTLDVLLPSNYTATNSSIPIITSNCIQGNFAQITVNVSNIPTASLCLYEGVSATRDPTSSGFAVLISGIRSGPCRTKKKNSTLIIIVIVAVVLVSALIAALLLTFFCWRRVRRGLCCEDDWEVEMK